MPKFAHISDVHLGAHREPHLRRLEAETFETAMSKCIELGVDFILISGDLFHVGIPDLGVVNSALRAMLGVKEHGIRIYAIYGSHDYTPNATSVIDILNTAGVLTNVFRPKVSSGRLELGVTVDEGTGAKLVGISARKVGLESKYYEMLDRERIEAEPGFRIFAFHSGITQFKPPYLSEMETVDISLFPKGLDYYAGGHIHERGEFGAEGYPSVIFPGPLFTGYGKDLEDTVRGEERGFYLVEFDERLRRSTFVPVRTFSGVYREYDFGGVNSVEASRRLSEEVGRLDVFRKVVALRAFGELAGGKVADMEFGKLRSQVMSKGAIYVHINRSALTSKGTEGLQSVAEDPAKIEGELFVKRAGTVNVSSPKLSGESGALLGMEILRLLRQLPRAGESRKDYDERISGEALKAMGVALAP